MTDDDLLAEARARARDDADVPAILETLKRQRAREVAFDREWAARLPDPDDRLLEELPEHLRVSRVRDPHGEIVEHGEAELRRFYAEFSKVLWDEEDRPNPLGYLALLEVRRAISKEPLHQEPTDHVLHRYRHAASELGDESEHWDRLIGAIEEDGEVDAFRRWDLTEPATESERDLGAAARELHEAIRRAFPKEVVELNYGPDDLPYLYGEWRRAKKSEASAQQRAMALHWALDDFETFGTAQPEMLEEHLDEQSSEAGSNGQALRRRTREAVVLAARVLRQQPDLDQFNTLSDHLDELIPHVQGESTVRTLKRVTRYEEDGTDFPDFRQRVLDLAGQLDKRGTESG